MLKGAVRSIDLQQILLTKPILNATRKLRANVNVSKFLTQRGNQGFKLTRLNRIKNANLDKLEPIVLRKVKGQGRKIDGMLKQLYEVIDGRHRISKAISTGRKYIKAIVTS